jgi:hypothetical protein
MSYLLERFLVTERHRQKINNDPEGEPGKKTPLSMKLDVPPDMSNIVVSRTRGDFCLIQDHDRSEVQTNCFEFPEGEGDRLLRGLFDFLYLKGAENDWGGIALRGGLTSDYLDSVEKYFNDYGLELSQIFTGMEGLEHFRDIGCWCPPSEEEFPDDIGPSLLEDWMEEYLHVGHYKEAPPLLYNSLFGNYVVFAAEPDYIGQLNRIGDYANIVLHNIYGFVITRIDE